MVGEVDTEVSRGLRSVSLGVELHLPVSVHVVICAPDGELAGPEELRVVLRPLTESLNGPGEGVFGVIADLGPWNNPGYQTVFVLLSVLPAPGLTVDRREDGWLFFFTVVHVGLRLNIYFDFSSEIKSFLATNGQEPFCVPDRPVCHCSYPQSAALLCCKQF